MTEKGSHIDRYFREGLEGYKTAPPDFVWDKLETRLHARRPGIIWLRRVASAAAVALLVISGLWFLNRQPAGREPGAENTPYIASEMPAPGTDAPETESKTAISEPTESGPVSSPAATPLLAEARPAAGAAPLTYTENETSADATLIKEIPAVPETGLVNPIENIMLTHGIRSDLLTLTAPRTGMIQEESFLPSEMEFTPEKISRWGIGGQFSPVFAYRHLSSTQGNEDLKRYYDQIEEGIFAFSGGLNLHYEATSKVSVYTGLYYSQMGLNIDRVGEFTLAAMGWETSEIHQKMAEKFYLVDHSTGTIISDNKNIKIVNTPEDALFNSSFGRDPLEYTQETLENADARIIQNYEFLEIPLIMKYRVVDKFIGMNILGGVSTNILVGNAASLFIEGINYSTIKTGNVNPLNYSGTIGMGLDMEVFPGLVFNVEPTFKYYLNTFSEKNLIGSHPYSVAVFSGVRYRF